MFWLFRILIPSLPNSCQQSVAAIPGNNISNSKGSFWMMLPYQYSISRDSPTMWPLCALFFILLQFYVPFYVKKEKIDNLMCLLEFECAKRLKAHIRAIPVYPKKYAHGFIVLCFVVVMQSFIMNSHEVFIHIQQGCFAGTGAIVRLPQCQWSKPDGYGKISQCITTTKHSKAKTVCIFLGIYCIGIPTTKSRWL